MYIVNSLFNNRFFYTGGTVKPNMFQRYLLARVMIAAKQDV